MKVKIGDKIYGPEKEPIMVIFEPQDKKLIANMLPNTKKYCVYPDTMTEAEVKKFMRE